MNFNTFKKKYYSEKNTKEVSEASLKKQAYNELYKFVKNIDDYFEDASYSFEIIPSNLYNGEYHINLFKNNKKIYSLLSTNRLDGSFSFQNYDENGNSKVHLIDYVGKHFEMFLIRLMEFKNPFKVAFKDLDEHLAFVEYIKYKTGYKGR